MFTVLGRGNDGVNVPNPYSSVCDTKCYHSSALACQILFYFYFKFILKIRKRQNALKQHLGGIYPRGNVYASKSVAFSI